MVALTDNNTDLGIVRRATTTDVPYIMKLHRHFDYELGFLSKTAYTERIERGISGGVLVMMVNNQHAGFICHNSLNKPVVSIAQACVDYQLQRRHYGMNLVEQYLAQAESKGVQMVTLRCLASTDANHFWQALGFRRADVELGRRGILNVWHKRLRHDGLAVAASRVHPCPDCQQETTDTWTDGGKRWATCPACTAKRISG